MSFPISDIDDAGGFCIRYVGRLVFLLPLAAYPSKSKEYDANERADEKQIGKQDESKREDHNKYAEHKEW